MTLGKPLYNYIEDSIIQDEAFTYVDVTPRTINPLLIPTLQIKEPIQTQDFIKVPISQPISKLEIKPEPVSVIGTPVTNTQGDVIYYNGGNLEEVIIQQKNDSLTQTQKTMQKLKDFYIKNKTYVLVGAGVLALVVTYLLAKKK